MDALHIAVPGRKLLLLIGVLLLVRGTVFRRVTAFAAVPVPPRSWTLAVVPAHEEEGTADAAHEKQALFLATRRSLLMSVITTTTVCWLPSPSLSIAAAKNENDILITVSQPGSPLGVELVDVTIGTPARSVAAIKTITGDNRQLQLLQPGMILPDFDSAFAVQRRLQTGPYPVTLTFRNLAAGGDAYADDGKPLVTANDALLLAQKTSSTSTTAAPYQVTQLQSVSNCPIRSRRNDVLEIQYTARYGSAVTSPNIVYDSSQQRGTGQPYQMVLGSGDMIPGVDQALYDMCPGEKRQVQIPPPLGYGPRARATYRIPDGATLYWNIELVSVNSVRQGSDITSREELEGRVPYSSALR